SENGAATAATQTLSTAGFRTGTPGDADGRSATVIQYAKGQEAQAKAVAAFLPGAAGQETADGSGGPVGLGGGGLMPPAPAPRGGRGLLLPPPRPLRRRARRRATRTRSASTDDGAARTPDRHPPSGRHVHRHGGRASASSGHNTCTTDRLVLLSWIGDGRLAR